MALQEKRPQRRALIRAVVRMSLISVRIGSQRLPGMCRQAGLEGKIDDIRVHGTMAAARVLDAPVTSRDVGVFLERLNSALAPNGCQALVGVVHYNRQIGQETVASLFARDLQAFILAGFKHG